MTTMEQRVSRWTELLRALDLDYTVDEHNDEPSCATCDDTGTVEERRVVGSWASAHGPQLEVDEAPCPDCQPDDDDAPEWYLDRLRDEGRDV